MEIYTEVVAIVIALLGLWLAARSWAKEATKAAKEEVAWLSGLWAAEAQGKPPRWAPAEDVRAWEERLAQREKQCNQAEARYKALGRWRKWLCGY